MKRVEKLTIVKIGGTLIENPTVRTSLCRNLAARKGSLMVVHGGGKMASALAEKLGVEVKMHQGRRITDLPTLNIAVMCYAGLANKLLTAQLRGFGVDACGVSGCDMGCVISVRREVKDIDWGEVGDVERVDYGRLSMLLDQGIVPVISPITCTQNGELLNTNADSVASAVARAMCRTNEVEMIFCLDKAGVLMDVNDPESVVPLIDMGAYQTMKSEGKIFAGMIPKLDNAFELLECGIESVRLTDADHIDAGTLIVK